MGDQTNGGLLSPYLAQQRLKVAKRWICGKVLDFGCGYGGLASLCSPSRYLGFDRDEKALAGARLRYPQHAFTSCLPLEVGVFDRIFLMAVLEHLPKPEASLRLLKNLLTAEGKIIFTTPTPWAHRIHAYGAPLGLFSQEAAEEHEHRLGRDQITQLLINSGFVLESYNRFLWRHNQLTVATPAG